MAAVAHHPVTNYQAIELLPGAKHASAEHASVDRAGAVRIGMGEAFGRLIQLWRSRIRERSTFVSFDSRDLRDIGMSRWDLERELSKPFWRG